jgi:hypothetical protein
MRQYLAVPVLLVMFAVSSCTPPQVIIRYSCDGNFSLTEDVTNAVGAVTVTPGRNVRAGARGIAVARDTVLPAGTIHVNGVMENVCEDGSVSYTRPNGSGVTVTLEAASLKATAPPSAYAAQDGKFKYDVTIECCPGSTSRNHGVSIDISPSIAAASISKTQVKCIDNSPITIEGQMAGHGSGYVTITIDDGAGRVCRLVTNIARDH